MKYYAVRKGYKPGIYETWDEAKLQVHGYSGAQYKSFASKEDAINYLNEDNDINKSNDVKVVSDSQQINQTIIDDKVYKTLVYTDGSCKDNKGGIGIVIITNGLEHSFFTKLIGYCTNNIAELYAIYQALLLIRQYNLTEPIETVQLYTDSDYCVKIFNEYIYNWLRNDWKNSSGETVANIEIIQSIYAMLKTMNVKISWVKGHSGNKYNDMADALADKGRVIGE